MKFESSKKAKILIRAETYSCPSTAPIANVGVKIPPGIGQLNVRAVKTNFITKNMIKYPSYNSHLSPSVSTKLKQKISKTYQA